MHEHEMVVRRVFEEVVNEGQLELVHELYHPDFVDRVPNLELGQQPGPAGIAQVVSRFREDEADLRVVVEEVVASGDAVASRETWFSGSRPRSGTLHLFHFREGRIVEEWSAGFRVDAPAEAE